MVPSPRIFLNIGPHLQYIDNVAELINPHQVRAADLMVVNENIAVLSMLVNEPCRIVNLLPRFPL